MTICALGWTGSGRATVATLFETMRCFDSPAPDRSAPTLALQPPSPSQTACLVNPMRGLFRPF
eukprot:834413-Pleurochrysis_carterae.AAC.3